MKLKNCFLLEMGLFTFFSTLSYANLSYSKLSSETNEHLAREMNRDSGRYYEILSILLGQCENESYKNVDLICFPIENRKRIKDAIDLIDQNLTGYIGSDFKKVYGSNPIYFFQKYTATIINTDSIFFKIYLKIAPTKFANDFRTGRFYAYNLSGGEKGLVAISSNAYFKSSYEGLQSKQLAGLLLHEASHGKFGAHTCNSLQDKDKNSIYGYHFRFYHYLVSMDETLPLGVRLQENATSVSSICDPNQAEELNLEIDDYYAKNINPQYNSSNSYTYNTTSEPELSLEDLILESTYNMEIDPISNVLYITRTGNNYAFKDPNIPVGANITISLRFISNTYYQKNLTDENDSLVLSNIFHSDAFNEVKAGHLVEATVQETNGSTSQTYAVEYID